MENLKEQIQELQRSLIPTITLYFFRRCRCLHRKWIPDFRSVDGLYHQQYDYPPETILSHSFTVPIRRIFPFLPE